MTTVLCWQVETCDPWMTNQFLAEVSKIDQSQACGHCLSDCDSVKYQVSVSSSKFRYSVTLNAQ